MLFALSLALLHQDTKLHFLTYRVVSIQQALLSAGLSFDLGLTYGIWVSYTNYL